MASEIFDGPKHGKSHGSGLTAGATSRIRQTQRGHTVGDWVQSDSRVALDFRLGRFVYMPDSTFFVAKSLNPIPEVCEPNRRNTVSEAWGIVPVP